MDIAEVAKRSGVAASALRYYERKGLIRPMARQGGRRHFAPAVLEQLTLIALGQAAGFSLDEIQAMFTPAGAPNIDRGRLAARAAEIDRTVKGLMAMSEGLRHAAVCPAPSHTECPSFQRLLKAAAAGALGSVAQPTALGKRVQRKATPATSSGKEAPAGGEALQAAWQHAGRRG